MLGAQSLVPKQTFEDRVNVLGSPQHPFQSGATAPDSHHDEVADGGLPRALAVDDDGRSRLEEGLADEELAAAGELADEELHLDG
jgi:hypothetical protein